MALTLGDRGGNPARAIAGNVVTCWAHVDIGASGAPTLSAALSDPGISIVRDSAGTYTVTVPAVPARCVPHIAVVSATPTIISHAITAWAPSTGTLTFETHNEAAAATDPASGDDIIIQITGVTTGT